MSYYARYHRNRLCPCARCRISCSIGPAVLVTLGVLFLLDTQGWAHFDRTWPVLLIVIGVIQVLRHSASSEGHVPPPMVAWTAQPVQPPAAPSQTPGSNPVGFAPGASQPSASAGAPEAMRGGTDHV